MSHADHSPVQQDTSSRDEQSALARDGLYDATNERDACGLGFVAQIKGIKSHSIIQQGLLILENLDHRGAVGADKLMGDGSGIMIQIPDDYFRAEMAAQGVHLPPPGEYGVGMVFMPKEHASRLACVNELERAVRAEGQVLLGWRDVPVDREMPMSPTVRAKEPVIRQIFIGRGPDVIVPDALERKLYVIRKTASSAIQALKLTHSREYYVPSMSCRTVIYKGLLLADQVGKYYKDLADPRAVSAFALVHQRFSTNTFPEWPLAHPYRMVAHNGEINTVKGNFNWMRAREGVMRSPVLGEDLAKLYPISFEGQSDTATFDNALELLTMAGYPLAHAAMMMIPEAWEQHEHMDPRRRAFYEYHAAMIEPWDGPAAMAFTDGKQIGATLDRNGLRPARYIVTDDDLVVMASESGVLPIPENRIVRKWRLQPGKMFLIDFEQGRIVDDEELKNQFAFAKPYRQWIETVRIRLDSIAAKGAVGEFKEALLDRQQAFGTTQEDIKFLMSPMAAMGEEGTGSMGNDSPLAVLSDRNKPLYHYFKQLFAQVTNPPIDPIREAIVMSLNSFIGPKPNLLDINAVNPPMRLEVDQPILDFDDMARLRGIGEHSSGKFRSHELDICYPLAWGAEGIEAKLASLCAESVDAIRGGHNVLIITDRRMDREHVAIPALLALSAVHHHLVREGLRTTAGLVVETGSAREVHHFAVLAGYGAEAVHPYLALETLVALHKDLPGELSRRQGDLQLHQGHRQGAVEDHVQDGREHLHVLLRRAALRGHRAGKVVGREVLPRHGFADRRHRRVPGGRGGDPHAPRRLRQRPAAGRHARRRWRIRLARARRRAHVDARRHCQAAAQRALGQVRDLQGIRADHQRPEQAPHDAARPVRVQGRPGQGHPPGPGGAGERDRQAFRHRRDVARLDQHRGAQHAGRGHEPHRRQEQHRRRRRGSGALPQRDEGHAHRGRHDGQRCHRQEGHRVRLRAERRRLAAQQDQAGGLGPLRRDHRIPGHRRPAADQDGAGRQAGRGRPAARRQGQRLHRLPALQRAGRRPDLARRRTTTSIRSRTWRS